MTRPAASRDGVDIDALTESLRAIASPVRLALLFLLREPHSPADVRIEAPDERADMRAQRPLSRPTIVHHLEVLEEVGLVWRDPENGRYVVNRQSIVSMLADLAPLARIEPSVEIDVDQTIRALPSRQRPLDPPPRLLFVGGPREGETLPLAGAGPWVLGRAADADLRVEFDPSLSRRQLSIARGPDGTFRIEALFEATNPVFLDFDLLAPGAPMRLAPGAVIGAGGSRWAFQGP